MSNLPPSSFDGMWRWRRNWIIRMEQCTDTLLSVHRELVEPHTGFQLIGLRQPHFLGAEFGMIERTGR